MNDVFQWSMYPFADKEVIFEYGAIYDICLKLILNSNVTTFCSFITSLSVVQLFWNFAQSL